MKTADTLMKLQQPCHPPSSILPGAKARQSITPSTSSTSTIVSQTLKSFSLTTSVKLQPRIMRLTVAHTLPMVSGSKGLKTLVVGLVSRRLYYPKSTAPVITKCPLLKILLGVCNWHKRQTSLWHSAQTSKVTRSSR